jgi:hypothetical protein
MRSVARNRTRAAVFALLLPLALGVAAAAQEAAPAQPAQEAPAAQDAPAPAQTRTPEELQALAATIDRGMVGTILRITPDEVDVRELTEGSRGQSFVRLRGGKDVAVSGLKESWEKLAQGDLVAVSYKGDPPRAQGVRVLPASVHPDARTVAVQDPYKKPRGREFVGWIKQIDAKQVVLRTPDGPRGSKRKGAVKTFVRHEGTRVELLRDSWDALKKGDRVAINFGKGEPSPADVVKVVLRGGEKPLPRGLATRLFDARYDQSVKDVDGIGEWPPGKPWPPVDEASAGAAAPQAGAAK